MLLIKKANIINAEESFCADILIDKGKIIAIESHLENIENTSVIEAQHLLAFPGGIDPHVHFSLPTPAGNSSDDFYTGSLAAISGGTTTIIDFVTPQKNESLISALNKRKKEATTCLCDYSFHMGIVSVHKHLADEIKECVKEGITSFKVYLAYRDTIGINYELLKQVMQMLAENNAVLAVHCEDGEEIKRLQQKFISENKTTPLYHALSRPGYTETDAVREVIKLADETGCTTYFVHISMAESAELIKNYKGKARLYLETCPQYLFLDDENYNKPLPDALKYVISPPLRSRKNIENLWIYITNGTFDVLSTDHCPFNTFGQKDCGINDFTKIPNGAGGVEYRLALLYTYGVLTGKISMQRFVALTSTHAARIFGLYPKKGVIAVGSDADIVLWNPETERIISVENQFQRCDSNIYEGMALKGAPEYVICKGNIVFKQGKLYKLVQKGKFLKRIIH